MIYLDANATTPIHPQALDAMLPWLRDGFANPSGSYAAAKRARKAIETARAQVAALLGAQPEEIVFTSGGTESANAALRSLDALAGPGNALVSAIEHSAVLRCVDSLARGAALAPVTAEGVVDLQKFREMATTAAFISLMAANNETGVIQPLAEAVEIARQRGIPIHSDAVQLAGKLPLDVKSAGVDLLSISAHKFHGPKGVGALYIRSGLRFQPLFQGGGQESGRRSGTENVAGIVGMGAAAEIALNEPATAALTGMRDEFERIVEAAVAGVTVNGRNAPRLPNTSHLSFDGCDSAGLLILLDEAGVACSAGSACMTGKQRPSHVQLAMGIPEARAKSSLRFSFSRLNSLDETRAAAALVAKSVEKLRRVQGAGVGPVAIYSA